MSDYNFFDALGDELATLVSECRSFARMIEAHEAQWGDKARYSDAMMRHYIGKQDRANEIMKTLLFYGEPFEVTDDHD